MEPWTPPKGAVEVKEWTPPKGAEVVEPPKPQAQPTASTPQGASAGPLPTASEPPQPTSLQPSDISLWGSPKGTGDIFKNADQRIKNRGRYQDTAPQKTPDIQYDKPQIFAAPPPPLHGIDPRETRIEDDWNNRIKEFTPGQYTPSRETAMKEAGTWTAADELRKGREKREFQANILRRRGSRLENQISALRDQGWAQKEQQLAQEELQLRTAQEQGQQVDPALVEKFQKDMQDYQQVMQPLLNEQKDISAGFDYIYGRDQQDMRTYEASPEVRDQKGRQGVIDQKYQEIDEKLKKGELHWYSPSVLEAKVIQPTTSTATKFLFDAAGALGRTLDQYGNIPNKVQGKEDYYSPFAEAADNLTAAAEQITTTPSDWKKPIIKQDWSIETNSLMPKLMQAATYMGLLGASGAAGGNPGLTAAAYASQEEDYYREAISSGLTPGQAQAFSMPAAMTQALLEHINPGPLMSGKAVKEVMMEQTMKALRSGMSPASAVKEGAQYILGEATKEGLQEGSQAMAESASRGLSNLALGSDKLDASLTAQSLAEQTLLGATMGFLAAAPGGSKKMLQRPLTAQTMDWAARNKSKVEDFINKNGGEQKDQLLERLNDIDKLYTGNRLKEVKPEVSAVVAPKIAEVQDIEANIKESPMDPAIEAAVGDPRVDQKEKLTREILTDMGVKEEDQEDALVEAKIIPPPLDEEGKPVKPKKTRRKAKPVAEEVTQQPEEDAVQERGPETMGTHEGRNGETGGTVEGERVGQLLKGEETPGARQEEITQTAAPTAAEVGVEPVSSTAAQPITNEGQQPAEQAPAPEEGTAVQDVPVQAPTGEGFKRTDFTPVKEITKLQESKDKQHISFAIPGFEEYNITVSRVPGEGWKAFEATTHAEITPQGQGTAKLAAADAWGRMDRAGKEKFDRVIASLHASAQAERAQENVGAESSVDQASPKKAATERIPVSPATGEVRDRRDVLKDLSKGVKRTIRYQKPGRRTAAGTYSPGSAAVKIRYAGDLDVTAHEIGHALDDSFSIVTKAMNDLGPMAELMDLAQHGSTPPKGHPNPSMYKASEGMAEYIRARIVNPEEAAAKYPELTSIYDKAVSDDAKKTIDKFSQDVRAMAGATGAEMVMSNVDFDPKKSDSVLKDLFKKDEGYHMTFADRLRANWVNPLRAFQKAIAYAQDVQGHEALQPSKDPYLLARLLLHINGKTSEILDSGMIDAKNQVIHDESGAPKNLKWLLDPMNSTSEQTLEKDMKDVIAYMIAERTVELSKRFGRTDILTGIGGGIYSDVAVASKALTEFFKDPERLARIQEAASRYRQMAAHTLEYLKDKGRISEDQFNQIQENNLQYVALQRIMEAAPGEEIEVFRGPGSKLGSSAKPIKSIYGSSRTILNPYVALMDSIHKSVKEADRNEVMMAFTDLLRSDRQMYEGEPMPLSDVGNIGKQGDKNSITVFNKGVAEHWTFDGDLYKALKGLDEEGYKIPALFRAPASVLRWTVTHFPVFAARNIVRDLQSRLILSDASGIRDLVGNKEHWHEVARAGGLNAGYYLHDSVHYNGLLREAMNEIAKNKKFILADPRHLHRVWEWYTNTLYKSEGVNRVAEYRAQFKKAKSEGMDNYNAQLYAAFRSSDLIDFALGGHHARVANQVIPFTNAMIQGLRSAVVHGQKDPGGFMARIAMYGILPSVAMWLLAHQDDDDAKEYEALPAYQRDMFFNFKIGPDKWVSIPKPFELSLPGAAIERALSQGVTGNKNAWDGYAGSVAKSFLPDESALAGPGKVAVELMANYDFFRNKTIVPPEDEKKALDLLEAEGKTEAASRIGQIMQDAVGMDARKWDHLIESQFSYFGKTALKLSDLGREDSRHQFDLSDLGFFKGSPAYNSAIVTKMTQMATEYGLTSERSYKNFRKAADRYFAAKDAKERDRRAEELRDMAEKLIPIMEHKSQRALKKAEAQH